MIITDPIWPANPHMRQTAPIALMAQTGSFVPASSAHIGIIDRIFTRVGASDDLSAGQSTFMVEMTEVASILKTHRNSLLIIEIQSTSHMTDGDSWGRAGIMWIKDTGRKPCSPPTITS